jgi:hypothetical protein
VSSLGGLMTELTGHRESLRQAFATRAFEREYARRRGFDSRLLGMPLDAANNTRNRPTAIAAGNGYVARFRGGELVLAGADGNAEARNTHEVQIMLVALECRNKQEVTDEVVGSVAYFKPSTKSSGVVSIEKLSMGTGARIAGRGDVVYEGAIANINLSCSLVEKDSGDTTEYRKKFAQAIADAAKMGATASGVDSEAMGSDTGWLNDVSIGLSNLVFDLIGADDDPYNVQTFEIPWTDMVADVEGRLEQKILKRPDDPATIVYTHERPVTGKDGGNDLGEYGFYFHVRTRPRPENPEDFGG